MDDYQSISIQDESDLHHDKESRIARQEQEEKY